MRTITVNISKSLNKSAKLVLLVKKYEVTKHIKTVELINSFFFKSQVNNKKARLGYRFMRVPKLTKNVRIALIK